MPAISVTGIEHPYAILTSRPRLCEMYYDPSVNLEQYSADDPVEEQVEHDVAEHYVCQSFLSEQSRDAGIDLAQTLPRLVPAVLVLCWL